MKHSVLVQSDDGAPRPFDAAQVVGSGRIWAVADALGPASRSAGSAQLVVGELIRHVLALGQQSVGPALAGRALEAVNRTLREVAPHGDAQPDLAVAATLVLADDARLVVGHVGNVRLLRLRDGELAALTRDHSALEAATGDPADFEPFTLHTRTLLSRTLGTAARVEPTIAEHDVRVGDRWLLCTDGLWSTLPLETIARVLRLSATPGDAVDAIQEAADGTGGGFGLAVVYRDGQEQPPV